MIAALLTLLPAAHTPATPDSLADARALLRAGRYRECLDATSLGVVRGIDDEGWHLLRLEVLRALGDCAAAPAAVEDALEDCRRDAPVWLAAYRLLRDCGRVEEAEEVLDEAHSIATRYRQRYEASAAFRVAAGRIALERGADAKEVLDEHFTPAKALEPEAPLPHQATAELALSKHDNALAAEAARAALARDAEDPDSLVLLARALATSDGAAAGAALDAALAIHPRHAGAVSAAVELRVAGEQYQAAVALLEPLLAVDSGQPEAWAWRAVIAHLEGDPEGAATCRARALERWDGNPDVDHLIGRELSRRYRFAEGAAAQERALERDPRHAEARFCLAQDLLRLGREDEGWRLVEQVADDDPYHVVAYNLSLLREVLASYATLRGDGLLVRMEPREAAVYGPRVLALLAEARDVLAERYAVTFDGPITLELFEEQKDFAVRTFGLPGGEGFLGVCFGDVITMKSPVSQGEDPSNWEAVLWHELCHAVTLRKTNNRMPRWLSEGISVWEERRRDPSWGRPMRPEHRARILAGEAWPIANLGRAFRQPEGPLGLELAYLQSSLAVEHLVEAHGLDALLALLDELAAGVPIERALAAHDGLEERFQGWLRERAERWAPGLTWEPVQLSRRDVEGLVAFTRAHPQNVLGLNRCADALLAAGRLDEARELLARSLELCPDLVGGGCAYELLARLEREARDEDAELAVLDRWLAREADALPARLRRMELYAARGEHAEALAAARAVLAVQPMLAVAHRTRARAAAGLGEHAEALAASRSLLALDPVDPARVHFQIAEAARALGDEATARRQVLMALEEAPRFREAHALLLELHGEDD